MALKQQDKFSRYMNKGKPLWRYMQPPHKARAALEELKKLKFNQILPKPINAKKIEMIMQE